LAFPDSTVILITVTVKLLTKGPEQYLFHYIVYNFADSA
jgi:hypothetical protein